MAVTGSTPQYAAPGSSFANPLAVSVIANNPLEPVIGGLVSFTVNPGTAGAGAELSVMTAIIGADGVAMVTATANLTWGPYTITASAAPTSAPTEFNLANVVSISFVALSTQSVIYGTYGVTVSGGLSAGAPVYGGETVAVTLGDDTQIAAIDAGGQFSTTLFTASLTVPESPYTITYAYTTDGFFASANATSMLVVVPATPSLGVEDPGGTFNGHAFPAVVDGSAEFGLEGFTSSLTYYSGSYSDPAQLSGLTPLAAVPFRAGLYTAVVSFPGSADYASTVALASFTIARATPTVNAHDPGGNFEWRGLRRNRHGGRRRRGRGYRPPLKSSKASARLSFISAERSPTSHRSTVLLRLAAAPSEVGEYTVVASFAGSVDYAAAAALAVFAIGKGVPRVSWSAPESIVYGTPLQATVLDAQADMPGDVCLRSAGRDDRGGGNRPGHRGHIRAGRRD